jgi:hypothetical protein
LTGLIAYKLINAEKHEAHLRLFVTEFFRVMDVLCWIGISFVYVLGQVIFASRFFKESFAGYEGYLWLWFWGGSSGIVFNMTLWSDMVTNA